MDDNIEEEKDLTPEEVEKKKIRDKKLEQISEKSEELMAEAMEVMLDDEEKKHLIDKVKKLFKDEKVPYSLSYIEAFNLGFKFGFKGAANEEYRKISMATMMLMKTEAKKGRAMTKKNLPKEMEGFYEA